MQEKVAILNGATSMIGRACALTFSQNGYRLMLCGRSQDKLKQLADSLPGTVDIAIVEDASQTQIYDMVEHTMISFGKIDTVIQNVATYPWKLIQDISLTDWQKSS